MPQMQMLDLELLINSRYPFIAVTTDEEDRLQDMLRRLAVRLAIPFYVWTPVEGLIRPPLKELASPHDRQPLQALAQVAASREDGLYLFKDLHKFLGDPAVVRRLHDLAPVLSRGRRALILTACDLDLPPEIRSLSAMFKLELPSLEELKALVQDRVREPCVAVVLTDHPAALAPRLPRDTPRMRPRAPQKGAEHDRLIETVHHERVVRPRAPEVLSPSRKGEVVVGARIDEDVAPEST